MDKVSRNLRYLEFGDLSAWNDYTDSIFKNVLFNLDVPSSGKIVELGTFRCHAFRGLCAHFGSERCVGFDVVNYENHPQVIEKDVRQLTDADDMPIALGWNDLSDWASSPESKMAGARFLWRNLLRGAIYIDEHPDMIPPELEIGKHFDMLFAAPYISIHRKR